MDRVAIDSSSTKKRRKAERLRRNREMRARGIDRFGELVDAVVVPNRADTRPGRF